MRNLLLVILVSCQSVIIAQATANFTASVTIIEPVSVINQAQMNFASISSNSGGKVVLDPNDSRSALGGVVLEEENGVSAAKFLITGEKGLTVVITLPKDQFTLTKGSQNITLHSFTSNLPPSFQLSEEFVSLNVGATIEIEGVQPPGIYNSTNPMSVVVNYN